MERKILLAGQASELSFVVGHAGTGQSADEN